MSSVMVETVVDGGLGNASTLSIVPGSSCRKPTKWRLILLFCFFTAVGNIGGPMLQRLYYMHGGSRIWLSSFLQSVGFPLLFGPLFFLYLRELSQKKLTPSSFFMEPKLFFSSAALGLLLGLCNYMYSVGLSNLPVSTSSLLVSTQLAFTALFAFLIVKQRFTFYSVNSVVVMTLGAVVLALHTSNDRPSGVSKGKYLFGFLMTLGGAVVLGFSLPMIELAYSKSRKPITNTVMLQFQLVMNLSSCIFCTVGMLINQDFQKIAGEAREYAKGEVNYYVVLGTSALAWQFVSLGFMGVITCTCSLFAGVLTSLLLPLTEVAALIVYHEKFTGEKGMALCLCLWGFTSYFIGEYKNACQRELVTETDEHHLV